MNHYNMSVLPLTLDYNFTILPLRADYITTVLPLMNNALKLNKITALSLHLITLHS